MLAADAMLRRQAPDGFQQGLFKPFQLRENPLSRNRQRRPPQIRHADRATRAATARHARGEAMDFKQHIRAIPDFPQPGVLFYDISTLLAHPQAWRAMVEELAEAVRPYRPDLLVGIESRGFLVAAPLAYTLGCGFAMVRKKGKLPGRTARFTYDLEYGSDTIEIQEDAIAAGQRVVVLDDLVATGGTLQAAIELVRRQGGSVEGAACIIELTFLRGRERIGVPLTTMIAYDS
jgi:adenine phosphoribosyltransferase